MSKVDFGVGFSVLFERVIACWPEPTDVTQLHVYDGRADIAMLLTDAEQT